MPKGEGGIFNQKLFVAAFGNFKQGFLGMKLIQKIVNSGFRVSFSTIVEKSKSALSPTQIKKENYHSSVLE